MDKQERKRERTFEAIRQNPDLRNIDIARILIHETDFSDQSVETIRKYVSKKRKKVYVKGVTDQSNKIIPGEKVTPDSYNPLKLFDGSKTGRYIVTTAVNDTPVHAGFYEALRRYIYDTKSELLVFQQTYRNPTSPFERQKDEVTWDLRLDGFLYQETEFLNKNIALLKANINPTASNPLTGLESNTGSSSCVIPHPKQFFKSIPVYKGEQNKIAISTGAITVPNYSTSRAGERGGFHHVIGAVVIELEKDGTFHVRHISAEKDGSFYDIAGGKVKRYTSEKIEDCQKQTAMVWGDLHVPHHDLKMISKACQLARKLNTSDIVLHDVYDAYSVAKHDSKDYFSMYAREMEQKHDVRKEVNACAYLLQEIGMQSGAKLHVTRANHDEHLDQWLSYTDPKTLKGENVKFFHWLAYHKLESYKDGKFHNSLEFAINSTGYKVKDVNWLKVDGSLKFHKIECGNHGQYGANGARGSVTNFKKLATRSIIGHVHTPEIQCGAMAVGVMCEQEKMGYAKGPSSWMKSIALIYPNGKRTLLNYIKGKFYL